eukprot:scaffold106837_cov42-Phaeocystis_antarctica.AAC.1
MPCGPHLCRVAHTYAAWRAGARRHGLRERHAGREVLPRRENNRDIRGHLRGAAPRHRGGHAQGAPCLIQAEVQIKRCPWHYPGSAAALENAPSSCPPRSPGGFSVSTRPHPTRTPQPLGTVTSDCAD